VGVNGLKVGWGPNCGRKKTLVLVGDNPVLGKSPPTGFEAHNCNAQRRGKKHVTHNDLGESLRKKWIGGQKRVVSCLVGNV